VAYCSRSTDASNYRESRKDLQLRRPPKNRERNRRAARWLLGLCVVVAVFYGVRIALDMVYWNDPRHHEQQLEPWMTIGYVARSWKLDPSVLRDSLALAPGRTKAASLGNLARKKGMDFEVFAEDVMDVIAVEKALTE
jgi:hypothetical protein